MADVLDRLRDATRGANYEGRLYLVGGIVRDKILGLPISEDIDIVLEDDAAALAAFLFDKGITDYKPVIFPRFGTAMVSICGQQVELVSARSESYAPESRKPDVVPASLTADAYRRDFTINTLMENLHTGKVLDLTGRGMIDLKDGIIQTPTDPLLTFEDDPLRMLRAIRFAVRFGFKIDEETYRAIHKKYRRLEIISKERIRDEFSKMLMTRERARAVEMLRETGLLSEFAPELEEMYGVTQNIYHIYDVWTHTLKSLELLPEDSDLSLRLAALFHDIGKPATRSIDDNGQVHFYTHQHVGAHITRKVLNRLRYPKEVTARVVKIIDMHLRVGEYDEEWKDAAVRRLARDAGPDLDALITLTNADKSAANLAMPSVDLDKLRQHIEKVKAETDVEAMASPLSGREIMDILGIEPGTLIGEIKDYLTNEVIEGRLKQEDKDQAKMIVIERWSP
ncbi:MAG: HDIG domain-containing metalloprotein [Armatimonadota bacterium]